MSKQNSITGLQYLCVVALPIALLIAQINALAGIILLFVFVAVSFLCVNIRGISILTSILILGYLFWSRVYSYIEIRFASIPDTNTIIPILSRLGLLGYLILLLGWYLCDKTTEHYFRVGNLAESIKFPFIWNGFNDDVLRVSGVFSIVCLMIAGAITLQNKLNYKLILMGIAFSLVNAVLEELLWRGFALNRLTDFYGDKIGLIIMSLTFGVYHYSLGFPLWVCMFFSLGGVYFGGVTIKSKGLLLAIIMHFSMNMLFVSMGIIF